MTGVRLREAGDAAVLLQLEPAIDARVNARAIAIASAVRRAGLPGVRDVLSTYRSVAVYFDPLAVALDTISAVLTQAAETTGEEVEGALIEIPVQYGGECGPDLQEVASFAGIAPADVVARHTSGIYRVFMLGFLPGFAYMGRVDASIAAPRRPTPRLTVAAGSVGIAGLQTGIYPVDSPGGWQIIGRTPAVVFDPDRPRPALFMPGDRVRFLAASGGAAAPDRPGSDPEASHRQSSVPAGRGDITVVRPGLFTTIQDEGRWGHQGIGVPVSGPMDVVSHRLANAIVGNDRTAATLEVTVVGPELRIDTEATVAVAGGDFDATIDGTSMSPGSAASCRAGSVLRIGERRSGGRTYIAFAGGIAVESVLGSRATHTRCRIGGVEGRALRAGDRLRLGPPAAAPARRLPVTRPGSSVSRLRVLPGPEDDFFPVDALDTLVQLRFTVTPQSDRMGYRLAADRPIPRLPGREMISDATFAGAIQVPSSGEPILLMADRQTTGGYPQIAVVISADLPAAGQLVPGDRVEFALCSRGDAMAALARQEEGLPQQ